MLENLVTLIEEYNPQCDVELIIRAYQYAESAHEGQYRKSGDRYFSHPVEVAKILIKMQMDSSTIAAGLLHDVLEDTPNSYEKMKSEFGVEIAELVEGVTKLTKMSFDSQEEKQAENLRKMFVAMAKDIRVVLIKLADRLHNMRTLKYQSDDKKKEKARETLEIFAPIAHRLGISRIKWELEDLSLLYMDPDGYYSLVERVAKKRKDREDFINQVIHELDGKLKEFDIQNEIYGRPKHFYSIYKKMVNQGREFEEIFDFLAIRVIVESIKDCYGVLGVVHTIWKPIPGRFKDYIAMPKPNMYQSLHTTVIGPKGDPFEIQIRTSEMNQIAEYGIAAHWKYKENQSTKDTSTIDEKLAWLSQMMEWEKETKDPKEFMESLKIDLFTNEVFVFTPKGKVIDLPAGATPIDFAYKIHSDIGNKCVGAKVDGRIVPLSYKLKNGNIVEVLTSSNSNGPSRDWLKIVQSSQAKTKIKQWFKKERREENIHKGKDMLEQNVKRMNVPVQIALNPKTLHAVAKRMSLSSEEDLYATLGYGGITLAQILPKIREYIKKEVPAEELEKWIPPTQKKESDKKHPVKKSQGVSVKDIDNIMVRFSKCCSPVPGDEIVGYITRGRGVSVHRKDCPSLAESPEKDERMIEVEWDTDAQIDFETEIQINATDRKGLLREITQILTDLKVTVNALNARTSKDQSATINIVIETKDIADLEDLMVKLKRMQGIHEVYRVKT
ncbi:MAG: bifunctional (p)ppGpp synthetase/guanosine-3',5'-bis(diphosphate) 3'-pyrophosphohydrolase [Bacillota bacterium]|nr:bifunctional (p)ppGpp synthetase/guanosine-3',5'-bis(diphosphate) 3'-pyrophosphohydrolase [Bacillota bacterium]MDW7677448.1 bifunctional (p)ppGpp synthetase/guanosine-3',5'-bis(diphosphate) 3'-pyrophosphohydrolase [Bacillota bacterium]